jgi:hypothetical protein
LLIPAYKIVLSRVRENTSESIENEPLLAVIVIHKCQNGCGKFNGIMFRGTEVKNTFEVD